jgi:hypothetical protein
MSPTCCVARAVCGARGKAACVSLGLTFAQRACHARNSDLAHLKRARVWVAALGAQRLQKRSVGKAGVRALRQRPAVSVRGAAARQRAAGRWLAPRTTCITLSARRTGLRSRCAQQRRVTASRAHRTASRASEALAAAHTQQRATPRISTPSAYRVRQAVAQAAAGRAAVLSWRFFRWMERALTDARLRASHVPAALAAAAAAAREAGAEGRARGRNCKRASSVGSRTDDAPSPPGQHAVHTQRRGVRTRLRTRHWRAALRGFRRKHIRSNGAQLPPAVAARVRTPLPHAPVSGARGAWTSPPRTRSGSACCPCAPACGLRVREQPRLTRRACAPPPQLQPPRRRVRQRARVQ